MPGAPNSDTIDIMFWGWLKGIFASILIFAGIIFIIYSVIAFENDDTSGGIISIIIGIGLSAGGSFLKYISKQTVRPTKK